MGQADNPEAQAKRPEKAGRLKFGYSKDQRLRSPAQFQRVYSHNRKIVTENAVLYFMSDRTGPNRLGITVSRKMGNAVKRNRAKRLLREAFRLNQHRVQSGHNLIVVMRKKGMDSSFRRMEENFIEMCGKAGLLAVEK